MVYYKIHNNTTETMEFKAPYYDRSITYSISAFYDHSLQSIMAVFIAKTPNLATELMSKPPSDRQDFFFYRFRKFAEAYVNLPLDDDIYFCSTSKEKAGTQGGGVRIGKFFTDRDKLQQSNHTKKIHYFEQKFKCCISGDRDQRLFLGVRQIWTRIAIERDELLAPYATAISTSYDDTSLSTPIPEKLNKYFVPFTIRNKVYQKWSSRNRVSPIDSREYDEEEPVKKSVSIVAAVIDDEEW